MNELNITKDTFQKEVLESDKPVIVDFWATWCGPCRMLGPTIAELAEEHPEIKVCKVNVDDEPDLAQEYGVMSIPFVASFKAGQLHKSSVGVQPKEALLALLDQQSIVKRKTLGLTVERFFYLRLSERKTQQFSEKYLIVRTICEVYEFSLSYQDTTST